MSVSQAPMQGFIKEIKDLSVWVMDKPGLETEQGSCVEKRYANLRVLLESFECSFNSPGAF